MRKPFQLQSSLAAIIATLIAAPSIAFNVEECLYYSDSVYEKAYCRIKERGKGQSLPSIQDFNNSNAMTQWLLVKKEARQIGIELEKPLQPQKEKRAQTKTFQQKQKARQEQSLSASTSASQPKTHPKSQPLTKLCRLNGTEILCKSGRYSLVTNNSKKPQKANYPFPDWQQEKAKGLTHHQYISHAYTVYIRHMLNLGLGGSTVSLTKFNALFLESQKSGYSFSERFQKSFKLLEQEKRYNAVKSRYADNLPVSIEACMRLSSKIIVCDDVTNNWVYRKGAHS